MPTINIKERFISLERNGQNYVWLTKRLWELSKDLAVFEYDVASFDSLNKDVWFGGQHTPTVKNVLRHYRRIENANFVHPIILSQDGTLFDGVHRICRAYLEGRKTISAVQFLVDPEPDHRYPILERDLD